MKRCLRCVLPDTRPDTQFVDGICSACIAYEQRPAIDWAARKEYLVELLYRARAIANDRGNHFDVIVPSSGGKDSHAQVLKLLELGARPLVVTASTCHLTQIGRANIENLARYATTIEVTANRRVRAALNRIALETVGDISWPEHSVIFSVPFRVAAQTGIPFIFYGENPQNQYGGPLETQNAAQMTRRWVTEFGGFLGLRPSDCVGQHGITEADMADYTLPSDIEGIEAHFLGQYIPWDSHANARVAIAAGMRAELPGPANYWHHENLDNWQTCIHDAGMFRKYGYGRGCAQVSVDIRAGRLDRAAALAWVKEHDGILPNVYAGVTIDEGLERIGLNRATLAKALNHFTNWELFTSHDAERLILKG